jgi:hypothetical protein
MEYEAGIIHYNYNDVPTVRAFTLSRKRIKCILGPFGSGKSSGCVMALLKYASEQQPNTKKIRKTRYVIVRNTAKELRDTTKATIDEWLAPLNPEWKEAAGKYLITFGLPDETIVESEWLLRALDRPDQVKDLLSLEVSGAWINEAREIPREVFDAMDGRIGRYPKRYEGYKCTYPVILMDSNPPDTDNWIYKYFEVSAKEDPKLAEKAELFRQPSGLSPEAENVRNLPDNYYENLAIGKDPDFIKVYVHGEYGYLREGKPVFPNFVPSLHIASSLEPMKSIHLVIGMDFGLFPAAVITQQIPDGRILILDELVSEESVDVDAFSREQLIPLLKSKYPRFSIQIIGDPAGASRSQTDSRTCFGILRSLGLKALPAYTNALQPRLQAVNQYLTRMVKGEPAFKIDSSCRVLIKALSGKYCFRKLRLAGERYAEVPDKGMYSHVADALQYACLGYSPAQALDQGYQFSYSDISRSVSKPSLMRI